MRLHFIIKNVVKNEVSRISTFVFVMNKSEVADLSALYYKSPHVIRKLICQKVPFIILSKNKNIQNK